MADQDGRHSEIVSQLLRRVTSSAGITKGEIFVVLFTLQASLAIAFSYRSLSI